MDTLFYRSLVLHVKCSFCKIFKSERVLDPQIISHVLTPVFHLHHVSHICLHLFFLLSVFIATFSHWLRLIMEALLSAYTHMWSVWKHSNEERNPGKRFVFCRQCNPSGHRHHVKARICFLKACRNGWNQQIMTHVKGRKHSLSLLWVWLIFFTQHRYADVA